MSIKDKLVEYKDAVVGNTIYDLFKHLLLCVGAPVLTSVISNILIEILNNEIINKYRIYITIVIIIFTLLIILEIATRKFIYRPVTPVVKCDYTVTKKEILFEYGLDKSRYELTLNVKSNINGLNRIRGKYTWSGSEEGVIRCETKYCSLIPLVRKDSFIEYEVELDKHYRKNETVTCKIIGDMPDSRHTFVPFFSTRITEDTKELFLTVHIPIQYNVREVICEEIAIDRNKNQKTETAYLDVNGKYTWHIKNPKLFYRYSVRWEL